MNTYQITVTIQGSEESAELVGQFIVDGVEEQIMAHEEYVGELPEMAFSVSKIVKLLESA